MAISCLLCLKTEGNNYMIYLDEFISIDRVTSCTFEIFSRSKNCSTNLPIMPYTELIQYIKENNVIGQLIKHKKSMSSIFDLIWADRYMCDPGIENTDILLKALCQLNICMILTIRHRPFKIHNDMKIHINGSSFEQKYSSMMEHVRLNSRVECIYLNQDLSINFIRSEGVTMPSFPDYKSIFIDWHPAYLETKKLVGKISDDGIVGVRIAILDNIKCGIAIDFCKNIDNIVMKDDNLAFLFPLTELSKNMDRYIYKACVDYDFILSSTPCLNIYNFNRWVLPPTNSMMGFLLGLYKGKYHIDFGIDSIMFDASQNSCDNSAITVEDILNIKNKHKAIIEWIDDVSKEGE